ncbi:MAG TPA: iron ABC transporter substrate-binding protein [Jatrophihabitans sp.]|jgi:iron(III) transport system substrate-binding protein|uniref:iron ABC transporter substrate-binding protein n=1 Tax=Jatrophihabitans sp. TaxID=1932789 RepID=UPI002F148E0B
MKSRSKQVALVASAVATVLVLAGCGSDSNDAGGDDTLTVYNAQHESLTKEWAEAFTKESGIKVELRNGSDFDMANQIKQEGDATPADVFLTENSPAMTILENAGLFADVDAATLAQVPKQYQPSTGKWVGIAARSTVFVYNTAKLTEAQLPKSMMDLADPKWKGKWGASPSGADYQAIVSAMLELKGADATQAWLEAMKTNFKAYKGNRAVMTAVNAGQIDGGVIYHYYWASDQSKTKENSKNTKLHYFGDKDPGAFVSLSGGGVLKSSDNTEAAQKFLKFVTGKSGQQILQTGTSFEYPVGSDVAANAALKPLAELEEPDIDEAKLNGPEVVEMMTKAGLL